MDVVRLNSLSELPGVFDGVTRQFEEIDYKPLLEKVAGYLRTLHAAYFRSQQNPLGTPWQPWFFRTFHAPKNHPTLKVSGRLRRSLASKGGENIEEYVNSGPTQGLTWGTAVPYAGIHQLGATFRTGIPLISRNGGYLPAGSLITIPKREHVGLSAERIKPITDQLQEFIVKQLKKSSAKTGAAT